MGTAGRVTINILPDDVLLLIFYFDQAVYVDGLGEDGRLWHPPWRWHRLVHVCRRWRSVVFGPPKFLDLRLVCGPRTRVQFTGIWPPFPIIIRNWTFVPMPEDYDFDAAIVPHNSVCEINLSYITRSQLQQLTSAMLVQFPALIHLKLVYKGRPWRPAPALPDGFLGGSAPRLQSLQLNAIAYPALSKLLLSATNLVYLTLPNTPLSEYFLPETLVTCLAVMANLKSFFIGFSQYLSTSFLSDLMESRRPPPKTRNVLPALTRFEFEGECEYLEDVLARIDAPFLDSIWITFVQTFISDFPQLAQFMRRTTRFQDFKEVHVDFNDFDGILVASLPPDTQAFDKKSGLRMGDWRISSLTEAITWFIPYIYMVEDLYLYRPGCSPTGRGYVEDMYMDWLELFRLFTGVKNLYVVKEISESIAFALQKLVGEDLFPALENIFLEDLQSPVQEAIGPFVAARQLLGRPVAVSHWTLGYVRRCFMALLGHVGGGP